MPTTEDVHKALDARAKAAITAVSATLPIEEENMGFVAGVRPTDGKWAIPRWVSAVRKVNTLGTNGKDLLTGVYQITLVYPPGSGSGTAWSNMATMQTYFKASNTFASNGQAVKINGTEESSGREVNNTERYTLSIYWESEISR
jgi:hypothetical protein